VPVTVKVNAGPPGAVAEGTSGFKNGTGLLLATSLLGIASAARVKQIHKTFDAVNWLIRTPLRDLRDNYSRLVERFKPSYEHPIVESARLRLSADYAFSKSA
jgi:hypothetical protein